MIKAGCPLFLTILISPLMNEGVLIMKCWILISLLPLNRDHLTKLAISIKEPLVVEKEQVLLGLIWSAGKGFK